MAGGVDAPPPKLLSAIGDYADGNGPAPLELEDDFLLQRYGWTFTELDEQDDTRLLPGIVAANVYAAVSRIYQWQDAAGHGLNVPLPTDADLETLRRVTNAQGKTSA